MVENRDLLGIRATGHSVSMQNASTFIPHVG
jgi:hypothetical protein